MSSARREKEQRQQQQSREDLEWHNSTIVGMPPPASQAPKSRSKSSKKGSGGAQQVEVKAPASVDKHLLTSLRDMGFEERQASEALRKHHNSFEEAFNELSQLAAKEAATQKATQPAKGAHTAKDKSVDADKAVARLIDMGFPPAMAQEAVVLRGNFDSSLEYLLEYQATETTDLSKRQDFIFFLLSFKY